MSKGMNKKASERTNKCMMEQKKNEQEIYLTILTKSNMKSFQTMTKDNNEVKIMGNMIC